jgi:hypothetical protein
MNVSPASFIQLIRHPIKFRLFLLFKLPAAFFSGVRVVELNEKNCVTSVPFKWLTQNPFRSTYFASLSMAAEMSTGVLGLMYTYKQKPALSMLVVKIEGNFFKKAIAKTYFTCRDGEAIRGVIEKAIITGEPVSFTATATGTNKAGEKVAEFLVTWSFKRK